MSAPVERKFVDLTISVQPNVTAPVILVLSALGQGIDHNDRIGNAVSWLTCQAKLSFLLGAAGTNQCRVMLFLDKMPDQNVVVGANVLSDVNVPIISPMNLNNNRRFKILLNRVVSWSAGGPSAIRYMSFYKRTGHVTRFTGPQLNINTVTAGSLYLAIFCSEAAGNAPTVGLSLRQRFVG